MEQTDIREKLKQAEHDVTYFKYLRRSLEAKLDRVEPFSPEFEETVRQLEETQEKFIEAARWRLSLGWTWPNLEFPRQPDSPVTHDGQ